ncbi:MAG: 4-hydroxy-L-threonine phosphate dehydrogenase PdxA [Gammaproteobacteria bacterium]|jgi:4-hydroxy-L-threonine phosphate dehydrogenase PdxA
MSVSVVNNVADIQLNDARPVLLESNTVEQDAVRRGEALAVGGQSVLAALGIALGLEKTGVIDAITFAPLKQAGHAPDRLRIQ